jgi:hypothetical protein
LARSLIYSRVDFNYGRLEAMFLKSLGRSTSTQATE